MFKIAEIFFQEPTKEHYIMEISRKAKIAYTSVIKYLKTLKKESIIIEIADKKGTRIFPMFKANINNENLNLLIGA